MGECQDCQAWEPAEELADVQALTEGWGDADRADAYAHMGWGRCTGVHPTEQPRRAVLWCAVPDDVALLTAPDFGCNQFAPKDAA